MLRCFENGAVDGIGLEMYIGDTAYNSEDFPYHDDEENANDTFWAAFDLEEMLKQQAN